MDIKFKVTVDANKYQKTSSGLRIVPAGDSFKIEFDYFTLDRANAWNNNILSLTDNTLKIGYYYSFVGIRDNWVSRVKHSVIDKGSPIITYVGIGNKHVSTKGAYNLDLKALLEVQEHGRSGGTTIRAKNTSLMKMEIPRRSGQFSYSPVVTQGSIAAHRPIERMFKYIKSTLAIADNLVTPDDSFKLKALLYSNKFKKSEKQAANINKGYIDNSVSKYKRVIQGRRY